MVCIFKTHDPVRSKGSCKRRGFCPSCGAKRMVESAALLVDSILPQQSIRQWVLSVPFPLRWLFASEPRILSKALEVVTRAISTYLVKKTGFTHATAKTGAVTLSSAIWKRA